MSVVLGVNSVYHESAAALAIDGRLVAACEEERFTRNKHGKPAHVHNAHHVPTEAIRACLDIGDVDVRQIDKVALSFSPKLRRAAFRTDPLSIGGDWGSAGGEASFRDSLAATPAAIRAALGPGFGGRIVEIPHHLAHAASAYRPSGFDHAAVLVADGIGEDAATAFFEGRGGRLREQATIGYPHSIGFLWEKLSAYLGFSEYDACKTMGLAAYGDPARFAAPFATLFAVDPAGDYRIDGDMAQFRLPYFGGLERLFGPRRRSGEPLAQHHYDLAAALQDATVAAMVALARRAARMTDARKLCLAGGVALNCVANAAINRLDAFDDIYIPPAPHDAGTAIGAALHGARASIAARPAMTTPYLGPDFDTHAIDAALGEARRDEDDDLAERVATMLCEGKIVAWFQGRMEFGPRALGNRSLLADPRRADMRDILNRKVKHREDFRPFAPSVLAEEASDWFDLGRITRSHGYMLFTVPARPERAAAIPAVLHRDGSSRVQLVDRALNPRYHALISAFARRTGVPMLLNTSFNDSEPIVCTPADALATFRKTAIDALVLGDRLIRRDAFAVAA